MERAMKVQEVILQAMAKKITWFQAAEIIGISDRHMRRWRERYEEGGFRGLFDRRRGKPSPKRVPMAVLERVLELYREKYFDFNLRHFHEKLASEHQIGLSYSWVKGVLQGAGLVARGRKRGVHRKRRPRRPLPGMLLHIDGSRHQWFQDERWYDLIVILDDASSEIYYAQLVEEESTVTVMAGLRQVIERKGVFCALYSDRGSHFWLTPKVGGKVDPHRLTQVGRALRELGIRMIPAYSPQARGRSERSFGTWQGRLPQELRLHKIASLEAANVFLREHYIAEFNRHFQVAAAQRGNAFLACRRRDLDLVFCLQFERAVNRDNTVSFQNLSLQNRSRALASHAGGLPGHGASAPGWNSQPHPRAALAGTLHGRRGGAGREKNAGATGCGKAARWKSHKPDFPTALGNPANCAGFPLSHSPDCCWLTMKPDMSCA
jgi:transposase